MKLLLTSAGLTTQTITNKLFELVGKSPGETTIAFIPTAMNAEVGDKSWFINNLNELKATNPKLLDIVEVAALEKETWLPRLEAVDILVFSGGITAYLSQKLHDTGLFAVLPKLLEEKVYMGISAGSMITGPQEIATLDEALFDELEMARTWNQTLGIVDFGFIPHLNSDYFKKLRTDTINQTVAGSNLTVYAADDSSALAVTDASVEIIGEGVEIFNQPASA